MSPDPAPLLATPSIIPNIPRRDATRPWRRWIAIPLSAVFLIVAFCAIGGLWYPVSPLSFVELKTYHENWASAISGTLIESTAELFGTPVTVSGDSVTITVGGATQKIVESYSHDPSPTLALLLAVAALWAGWLWRFGWIRRITLLLTGLAGGLLLLPALHGVSLGMQLSLFRASGFGPMGMSNQDYLVLRSAEIVATTALLIVLWLVIRRVVVEEELIAAPQSSEWFCRMVPPGLWASALAFVPFAITLALLIANRGYMRPEAWLIPEKGIVADGYSWLGGVVAAGVLLGVAALLACNLFGKWRTARFAWLPLLLLMPWGAGGLAGAAMMLALALAGSDEWLGARAGKKLSIAAWERLACRASRPLMALSIWAVVAAVCGAAIIGVFFKMPVPALIRDLSISIFFWPAVSLGIAGALWELWADRVPGRGIRGFPKMGVAIAMVGLIAAGTMGVYQFLGAQIEARLAKARVPVPLRKPLASLPSAMGSWREVAIETAYLPNEDLRHDLSELMYTQIPAESFVRVYVNSNAIPEPALLRFTSLGGIAAAKAIIEISNAHPGAVVCLRVNYFPSAGDKYLCVSPITDDGGAHEASAGEHVPIQLGKSAFYFTTGQIFHSGWTVATALGFVANQDQVYDLLHDPWHDHPRYCAEVETDVWDDIPQPEADEAGMTNLLQAAIPEIQKCLPEAKVSR